MSPATSSPCPHDLRPGTSVCLHCRRDERLRARARSRKLIVRYAGLGTALAALAVLGVAGFGAAQSWRSSPSASASGGSERGFPALAAAQPTVQPAAPDSLAASLADPEDGVSADSAAAGRVSPVLSSPAQAPVPAASLASNARADRAPLAPVIRAGRTELRDGMYAERSGDTVRVHFDTELGRTRRPEKFENVVRVTLPAVYGSHARSLMGRTAPGEIARAGHLLDELPSRGVRLALEDGWTLLLHPETRPGRDGPLVVGYRATVAR